MTGWSLTQNLNNILYKIRSDILYCPKGKCCCKQQLKTCCIVYPTTCTAVLSYHSLLFYPAYTTSHTCILLPIESKKELLKNYVVENRSESNGLIVSVKEND